MVVKNRDADTLVDRLFAMTMNTSRTNDRLRRSEWQACGQELRRDQDENAPDQAGIAL
jgi:hypothetical protein